MTGITREIGFKVQKRKVCPYPVFSGGGERWSCVILCKKVENNTKDNKSLEGGYGKRRTSDKRGTGKKTSAEKKTTSENQSAGISGSDRLGTDRAGGRFYDREIFMLINIRHPKR